jgi:uncharacterized protein YjbI with pentapeptide repeats
MHIQFEEVLLVSAKLPGFSFRKETLRRVDFSGADLRKGDFRMTVFEDCSLREAMVAGSRFEGSDLRGADLGGLRLVDANLFRGRDDLARTGRAIAWRTRAQRPLGLGQGAQPASLALCSRFSTTPSARPRHSAASSRVSTISPAA